MSSKKRHRVPTPVFSSNPIEPGHEYSTPKRIRVKQFKRKHYHPKAIEEETGVPISTQYTKRVDMCLERNG